MKNEVKIEFKDYLERLFLRLKLTNDVFSREIGVSKETIWAWRTGKRVPLRYLIARIKLWEEMVKSGEIEINRDIVRSSFAKRVIKARLKYKLTQDQLGFELGVSHNTVCKWERGTAPNVLNEERFNAWEKSVSKDKEYIKEIEEKDTYIREERKQKKAIKFIKKEEKEKDEEVELPDLTEAIFGDFGNQKAPWEYPEGHPKRRKYDNLRNSK